MQWILNNKEWIFSGVGVFILSIVLGFVFKNRSALKQNQRSGSNSKNYQAAGDIKIGNNND